MFGVSCHSLRLIPFTAWDATGAFLLTLLVVGNLLGHAVPQGRKFGSPRFTRRRKL